MASIKDLCGWRPDEERIADFNAQNPSLMMQASHLLTGERVDTHLWNALLTVKPDWKRGAQAIGDCQMGSAMVTMADGSLKRIDEVQVGEYVISGAGIARRVTALIHKPPAPREMVSVTTRSGLKPYTATVDHRVPMIDADGIETWKPIGTVSLEDSLVLSRGVDESQTSVSVIDLAKYAVDPTTEDEIWGRKVAGLGKSGRRRKPVAIGYVREKASKPVKRWIEWSEKLAWLFGIYAAEGSTDMSAANGLPTRITLNIGSHRKDDALKAAEYLSEIFDIDAEVTQVPSKPSVLYVRVSNRLIASFFYSLVNGNVYEKRLDKVFFTLPEPIRMAFVQGWFSGDGHVHPRGRGVGSTSSLNLARDLQRMLLSLGVEYSISFVPASDGHRDAYRIHMPCRAVQQIYPSWDIPPIRHRSGDVSVASALSVADTCLLTETGMASRVLKIDRFVYDGPVYCLEVEVDHTFIGDGYVQSNCVSWGSELACTVIMALQHVKGTSTFIAEAATEAIYGGCRVEALGKRSGGWSDGAFGAAAAKWVRDWGAILRVDMGKVTGISEHDLRAYNGKKAKDWGNYGCGGKQDGGKLDTQAKSLPVQHVVGVRTVEEAAAAIQNLYPLTIASMAGFGDMRRDANGIVRRRGQWAHQMCVLGVRWRAGAPEFRIFQSWGPRSCSGPDPGINHPAVSGCSWWCTAEDMAWILRTGDCWIYGDLRGLPPQKLDLVRPANYWFQPDRKISYEMNL